MLAAILATLLFCVSAVSATRTARLMGGTEANFWRLVLAAAMLAIYAHLWGGGLASSVFPIFLLSGLVGFGFGDVFLFQALPRLGSRLTILLVHCLAAPFAAVCEWLWMGTQLSLAEVISGLAILTGVAVALAPSEHLHIERRVFWPGLGFGILAAGGQGFGAVLSRYAFQQAVLAGENIDGMTAAYQRIIGGVIFGGLCLLLVKRDYLPLASGPREPGPEHLGEKWRKVYAWLILNAVTGPMLGVSCYQWALKTTPAGIVLPIVATTPLVIVPLSARLEGERATKRSLLGGLLAVAGAATLALLRAEF